MAALTDVQRLQARVEELERWVYGPGGVRGSRKVADGLVKVQVALGNIASKRERVKILYKKIEDLIKYLDPEYIDRIAIPDASKLQFILAEEQFILAQVALLEQVDALVPMLDSAHIKGTPCDCGPAPPRLGTRVGTRVGGQDGPGPQAPRARAGFAPCVFLTLGVPATFAGMTVTSGESPVSTYANLGLREPAELWGSFCLRPSPSASLCLGVAEPRSCQSPCQAH
uniref:Dynactin subunit 3 n=1 Tax=Oryctolagus cuniculus TaxID=9986 RepID=A0A5F9CYT8_RABIT